MENENLSHYECFYQEQSDKVGALREIYADNPYHARIYFMNEPMNFTTTRVMLFEKKNGDFAIVKFERKHGISKTNRIYSREKRIYSIYYSKKKFWYKDSRGVRNLSLVQINADYIKISEKIEEYFIKRFPWVEFLKNNEEVKHQHFNYLVKHKAYGLKKLARTMYKLPWPQCQHIFNSKNYLSLSVQAIITFRDYLTNVESMTMDFMQNTFLRDTLRMAKILDRTVSGSWSTRRLKEVHDEWSKELTDILFDIVPSRDLEIKQVFTDFAEYSGYQIFKETRELVKEGREQNHCVASYIDCVDRGLCAIYKIGDYTLELRVNHGGILYINQCRGLGNKNCPEILKTQINHQLERFNKEKRKKLREDESQEQVEKRVATIDWL